MSIKIPFTQSSIKLKVLYIDPETLCWLPLDAPLLRALDNNSYVAFTRELASSTTVDTPAETTNPNAPKLGANTANDPAEQDEDPANDTDSDVDYPSDSLFSYSIPGVLTSHQVSTQINLDRWKLLAQGTLIDFEDFRGWETMALENPVSVKGIVGELAAVLGPEVAGEGKRTGVMLFD